MWRGALQAREAGADVVAVTVWALLGSFNWPCLCTHNQGSYEPGVFNVRNPAGTPMPTRLAPVIHALATGGEPLDEEWNKTGWWRSSDRLTFPPPQLSNVLADAPLSSAVAAFV